LSHVYRIRPSFLAPEHRVTTRLQLSKSPKLSRFEDRQPDIELYEDLHFDSKTVDTGGKSIFGRPKIVVTRGVHDGEKGSSKDQIIPESAKILSKLRGEVSKRRSLSKVK
jgi:hypothetical protein